MPARGIKLIAVPVTVTDGLNLAADCWRSTLEN